MTQTKKRTEEEKVARAPIVVVLGGKKYNIAPLVIRDSREWRKKAAIFQAAVAKYASVDSNNPVEFEKSLIELLTDRLDQTIDLFFDYAKDLNRGKFESIATDGEIVVAFQEVIKIAFPFG